MHKRRGDGCLYLIMTIQETTNAAICASSLQQFLYLNLFRWRLFIFCNHAQIDMYIHEYWSEEEDSFRQYIWIFLTFFLFLLRRAVQKFQVTDQDSEFRSPRRTMFTKEK